MTSFEVRVAKEAFKFNAAHFVAYKNFRERIHGHNYQVAVRLLGSRKIGSDGYVVDFGDIKAVTKKVCKELNEHFLCPMLSDVIDITTEKVEGGGGAETVKLVCEDGSVFVFPKQDCLMLPLVHATAEELAIYLWGKILQGMSVAFLRKRGIHTVEITVAEAVGQEALFRHEIPNTETIEMLDIRTFLESGEIVPAPCLEQPTKKSAKKRKKESAKNQGVCDGSCQASKDIFAAKLKKLADAMNDWNLTGEVMTPKDLLTLLED